MLSEQDLLNADSRDEQEAIAQEIWQCSAQVAADRGHIDESYLFPKMIIPASQTRGNSQESLSRMDSKLEVS